MPGLYVGPHEAQGLRFPVPDSTFNPPRIAQRPVVSAWVGDVRVYPPKDRTATMFFPSDSTMQYLIAGAGYSYTFSVPIPWWAVSVDYVLLGAGGRGGDGSRGVSAVHGKGGGAATRAVGSVSLANHAKTSLIVNVGRGDQVGVGRASGLGDFSARSYGGADASMPNSVGGSVPELRTWAVFPAVSGGGRDAVGGNPGAGGGGGSGAGLITGSPQPGQNGGNGYVGIRFRSELS